MTWLSSFKVHPALLNMRIIFISCLIYIFIYLELTRGRVVPSAHFIYLWKLMQLFNKYVIELLGQEVVTMVTTARNLF